MNIVNPIRSIDPSKWIRSANEKSIILDADIHRRLLLLSTSTNTPLRALTSVLLNLGLSQITKEMVDEIRERRRAYITKTRVAKFGKPPLETPPENR